MSKIITRPQNRRYAANWERIFGRGPAARTAPVPPSLGKTPNSSHVLPDLKDRELNIHVTLHE